MKDRVKCLKRIMMYYDYSLLWFSLKVMMKINELIFTWLTLSNLMLVFESELIGRRTGVEGKRLVTKLFQQFKWDTVVTWTRVVAGVERNECVWGIIQWWSKGLGDWLDMALRKNRIFLKINMRLIMNALTEMNMRRDFSYQIVKLILRF